MKFRRPPDASSLPDTSSSLDRSRDRLGSAGVSHEFTLDQLQAADWVRFLEPLAGKGADVTRLRDDLEDALRLATWARNDVRIEVATSQIAEILETLVADSHRFGQHELDVLGEILLTLSARPTSS